MKPLLLALLVATLAACADDADTPTAAAQTSSADATDIDAAADAYLAAYPVRDLMADMTTAMAETAPPEARAEIQRSLGRVNTDTLEAAMRRSLVRTFTAPELNALAAFYASPEGRSVMAKMPQYTADVMPAIQQEVVRAVSEAQEGTP